MISAEIIHRDEFYLRNGSHPKDSMIILLDGIFTCSIAGEKQTVKKNDIFIFNKKTEFHRSVLEPITCIYLQFDSFPFPLPDGLLHVRDSVRKNQTVAYLERAVADGNDRYIEHYVNDVLFLFECGGNPTRHDPIVESCIEYFEKSYQERIDLFDVCRMLHVSKQWLIVKFKRSTARTPMEYLRELRLHHAKRLLRNSDFSMNEIALLCGFENGYYFSNAFKTKVGISPTEYRKRFRL